MAVVNNLWLRGTKQRLAGTVLYQSMGRTLQRELAPQVTNPRTPAQMSTRVRLANLVQLYKAGRGWMKASFENKKQTQSDYNAFVSANLANANVYLTKQQVAAGAGVVAPVVITKGSLPPVSHTVTENGIISDISLGNGEIAGKTVGEVSQYIVENNAGVEYGDQLSLIQYVQQTGPDGTPYVVCRSYEVILNQNNTDPISDYMPDYVAEEVGTSGDMYVTIAPGAPMGGYAFIISRTVGSTIRVSSQSIVLTADNSVYPLFTTQAAYDAAVASYGEGEAIFLSSEGANNISGNQQVTRQIVNVRIGSALYGPSSTLPDNIPANQEVSMIFNDFFPAGEATAATVQTSATGAAIIPLTSIVNTGDNIVKGTLGTAIAKPQGSNQSVTFSVQSAAGTSRITIPFRNNSAE